MTQAALDATQNLEMSMMNPYVTMPAEKQAPSPQAEPESAAPASEQAQPAFDEDGNPIETEEAAGEEQPKKGTEINLDEIDLEKLK